MVARLAHDKPTPSIFERPLAELVYLVFVFLPLVFWPQHPWRAVWASLIAIALFLPLHFAYYRQPRGHWMIGAVAALGFALIPFNPGGNTFIIYAAAMAAAALPARTAIAFTLALLLAMTAEFFWFMPTTSLAAGYTLMVVVIASVVVGSVLLTRDRERRNAELRLSRDEVARLAALAERERIGRDLHDLLGHTLSLVALKSELAGRLLGHDPDAARQQIGEVETVARQALAQVREAVAGIRATGLLAELAAARLALLSADVSLDHRLAPVELTPAAESTLALGLREAVTNVLRHAGASRVDVELALVDGAPVLTIADDGRGGLDGTGVRGGNGLAGMRERLAGLGGRLDVDSPADGGTRLRLSLPRLALVEASP
jgi:two-component system sensor histidine kinase DesK